MRQRKRRRIKKHCRVGCGNALQPVEIKLERVKVVRGGRSDTDQGASESGA